MVSRVNYCTPNIFSMFFLVSHQWKGNLGSGPLVWKFLGCDPQPFFKRMQSLGDTVSPGCKKRMSWFCLWQGSGCQNNARILPLARTRIRRYCLQILRNGIFQGPHPLKIKNCGPHPENFQTHGPNPNVELAYETNGHAASLGWEKKKFIK